MPAIRLGTRRSALARWQSAFVASAFVARHPGAQVEVVLIESDGDRAPELPLERMEGIGWFTASLERALLAGRIDLAIHSHKDLPVAEHPELVIAAIPLRGPVEDTLCARNSARLDDLPPGARVGTSSIRRTAQLLQRRADLECVSIRGNVPSRLRQVHRGELDGVVLARAGLERLGALAAASEVFDPGLFLPAPAQGALAVQARRCDCALVEMVRELDHGPTRAAVTSERALLHALQGGCAAPVGACATTREGVVRLVAGVFAPDGSRRILVCAEGTDPAASGRAAAADLLQRGAGALLDAARETLGRGRRP